ncbi:hypothetical protein [Bergeyella porcorum]
MKKIIYIVASIVFLVFFLITFFKEGKNIDDLKQEELSYKQLPKEVKKELQNIFLKGYTDDIIVIETGQYKKSIVKTGPWIDYVLLENTNTKALYRIARDLPYPYIIYRNKLYLSKHHNVIMINSNNIFLSNYIEYILE